MGRIQERRDRTNGCLPCALLAFIALVLFCIKAYTLPISNHKAGRVSFCKANLRDIGVALQNYHDTYGRFPPPYVTDSEGKRLHSWRVLLLPFLDGKQLYDRYHFDEPWDGPDNSKLHGKINAHFLCPSASTQRRSFTNYVALLGERTTWANERGISKSEISDRHSETILLIEITNSDIHWMEPRDISLNEVISNRSKTSNAVGSEHRAYSRIFGVGSEAPCHLLTIEGRVFKLAEPFDHETFKALATIDGGESLSDSWHVAN